MLAPEGGSWNVDGDGELLMLEAAADEVLVVVVVVVEEVGVAEGVVAGAGVALVEDGVVVGLPADDADELAEVGELGEVEEEVLEGGAGAAGLGESTERMRAQVDVVAAAPISWLCCWAEMALCMPMPRVSVMTVASMAAVWLGAPWMLKNWERRTASTIWLLVMGGRGYEVVAGMKRRRVSSPVGSSCSRAEPWSPA